MEAFRCPLLNECRFFNDIIENMPSISASLKARYCLSDSKGCARFLIFEKIGKEHVPDDVFPHELEKAEKMLRHYRIYGEMQ